MLVVIIYCHSIIKHESINIFTLVLIFLVPHSNEVYVNLTNLHWLTSIVLGFIILVEKDKKLHWICLLTIFIFSISGPFAIVLSFLLFVEKIFSRKSNWATAEITIAIGAIIQLGVVITSFSSGNRFDFLLLLRFIEILSLRSVFFNSLDTDTFINYKLYFISAWILINILVIYGIRKSKKIVLPEINQRHKKSNMYSRFNKQHVDLSPNFRLLVNNSDKMIYRIKRNLHLLT